VKSIRTRLILWLSGAFAFGTAAVLVATYTFAREEIGRVFDEELRQVARAVHLREDWVEVGTLRVAEEDFVFAVRAYDEGGRVFFETILPSRPFDVPQTFDAGFSVHESVGETWRVYTHVTPEGVVQVAQPEAWREMLARELALRMLLPVLILLPFFVLLAAWVLKRSLAPLDAASGRVRDRDAARLDPLPVADVPNELLPLVEQINALLKRLAASLEAQRRFVADAAHELRSPVTALALQAQLAERAQTPEARAAAFQELKRGTERASRLVQQLLDLARLEPGERAEESAPVDVAQLTREVVGSYAAQADARSVDLGVDALGPATVIGARSELRSLIANLVDNALRYAPRSSEVTVSVRGKPEAIEITVVDAGPGIPPDERERVFKRFQRVPGDQTRGSGLGLPIAKAIAERHRGTIALGDARPGHEPPGLTVRVQLPAGRKGNARPASTM
jgi:two-component system OmpR family sensor kinase